MKFREDIDTVTYEAGDGFLVDIVETNSEYSAYIYHEEYGVKVLMFGVPYLSCDRDQFIDAVESALPTYKNSFLEEYGDILEEYGDEK